MKFRDFLLGILFAVVAYLYKQLLDTEEKLIITEAELKKLQREQDAIEESYREANEQYRAFDEEFPLPDDPDKKLEIAMMDAIMSAKAREELGDNYLEDDEDDEEDDS